MAIELVNPIIVALDVDSIEDTLHLSRSLAGKIGAWKIGPRLIVKYGASLIESLAASAPVFVDNKYLDIPSTMEGAIRSTFVAGASLATVHCWAGPEALSKLAHLEMELNQIRPFSILGVTILTSFNQSTLPPPLSSFSIADQVKSLVEMGYSSGLRGFVCSPHEVTAVRSLAKESVLITPGVRMPDDPIDDQSRVLSPGQAIAAGATALVIGRPIIKAKNPVQALESILENIKSVQ